MRKQKIDIEYLDNSSKYDTNVVYILGLEKNDKIMGIYIGQTKRRISQRLNEHLNTKRRCAVSDFIVANKIDSVVVQTHSPHPWETLNETEQKAITRYKSQEYPLINKIKYKKGRYI